MARTSNTDSRPRIDISKSTKGRFKEIKSHLGFKTDAEVLAYLMFTYDQAFQKMTIIQDKEIKAKVTELINQESF